MSYYIPICRHRFVLTLVSFLLLTSAFSQNSKQKLFDKILNQYDANVLGIYMDNVVEGEKGFKKYLKQLNDDDSFVSYKSTFNVSVVNFLEYEIGITETQKKEQLAHIIIWNKQGDSKNRILESVYKKTSNSKIPKEIDIARNKWVKLCNEHDAKKLVEKMYTKDAIYYNRGRVLRGHNQLIQEYNYMNSPSYSLKLRPLHIERVSDTIIYEIGQCSGSYPLPYIFIWQKQKSGEWKVYMDSNY